MEPRKTVAIVGEYPDYDAGPSLFIFTVDERFSDKCVAEYFREGLNNARKSDDEDLELGDYAMEYVCEKTGGTCELVDPAARFNITWKPEPEDDDEVEAWHAYLRYLHTWANTHDGIGFIGMTPACYEEWLRSEWSLSAKPGTDRRWS